MNEDLSVRVVGSLGTILILLVAVTVGALLGNNPAEMFAWSLIGTITLSIAAVILIYRFEEKIDSM